MSTSDDPRTAGPAAPQPPQEQERPGLDAELRPRADHGEESYRGHRRLEGRVALVTGADSGIGRAVTIALAREGADVALSYLPEEEDDADESERWVRKAGRRALRLPGDASSTEACERLVELTVDELGQLDVVVANAATQTTNPEALDVDDDELEEVFRVNALGTFRLIRAAAPHLEPGGNIICTTSIQSFRPKAYLAHYAATKAAITSFIASMAGELAERGVRINGIAPGPVWTPLNAATFPAEHVEGFGQDSPFGRPAQPAEIAPAFVFLASDEARYVSGEVLAVTGGRPIT